MKTGVARGQPFLARLTGFFRTWLARIVSLIVNTLIR